MQYSEGILPSSEVIFLVIGFIFTLVAVRRSGMFELYRCSRNVFGRVPNGQSCMLHLVPNTAFYMCVCKAVLKRACNAQVGVFV